MDLLALGTPVIDSFAKADDKTLKSLKLKKGATNHVDAKRLSAIERKFAGKIFYKYPGDNARNVCEGVAALGGFAGLAGAIAPDKAGAAIEANLSACGISNFLQEKKGSTGKILVLVTPDGQRTFCADLGVSTHCSRLEKIAAWRSKMFYVTSITLCEKGKPVAAIAHEYLHGLWRLGKKIAISLESPPMVKKNRAHLLRMVAKYADLLFMNEEEAEALLGRNFAKALPKLKPKIPVFLKKGSKGSSVFLHGKEHRIPTYPAKGVDTTGAGDAYAAGVIYGLSRKYSMVGSAKLGSMLAARVVENFGAGIPLAHARIKLRLKPKKIRV
jgi:sugar/nucleoside kinase (ribokinase family)